MHIRDMRDMRDMSLKRMMNVSLSVYEFLTRMCDWVYMSSWHIRDKRDMSQSCHIRMSHVKNMHESCHAYERVMSEFDASGECVMSHI